jgi:hypothetical protein
MTDQTFPSLRDLLREIEAQAADRSSLPQVLARVICTLTASEADPYLLLGVLAEGIAQVTASRIPGECQADVAGAALALVQERLQARHLL